MRQKVINKFGIIRKTPRMTLKRNKKLNPMETETHMNVQG